MPLRQPGAVPDSSCADISRHVPALMYGEGKRSSCLHGGKVGPLKVTARTSPSLYGSWLSSGNTGVGAELSGSSDRRKAYVIDSCLLYAVLWSPSVEGLYQ